METPPITISSDPKRAKEYKFALLSLNFLSICAEVHSFLEVEVDSYLLQGLD